MKEYILKTTATMKEYNCGKWWIDSGIVPEIRIAAESVKAALAEYAERVQEYDYITISKNALKTKSPMYRDTPDGGAVQVGFVITGSADFEKTDSWEWSKQYIDLWVEVIEISRPDFMEVC